MYHAANSLILAETEKLKILIIQTAFTGDVILATPLLEKLHGHYPEAAIDFMVRKGNESLFDGHPFLHKTIVWDKKKRKLPNLLKIIIQVRRERYDVVVNLHRYSSSGMVTWLSGARQKAGFDKNPFSFCFTHKVKHIVGDGRHECERNMELASAILPATNGVSAARALPRLYPRQNDFDAVKSFAASPFICIAPSSVWFTKQYPAHKWVEFIKSLPDKLQVCLLGSAEDRALCESIKTGALKGDRVHNLAGRLTFLQSAALMKSAVMNYMNDSAPMHLASAVNAPADAIFCSTVPAFGFGPLSEKSFVTETDEKLDCRPCGLHGYRACPRGHFKCAETIPAAALLKNLDALN
jgi:heptosyltransferase-2